MAPRETEILAVNATHAVPHQTCIQLVVAKHIEISLFMMFYM